MLLTRFLVTSPATSGAASSWLRGCSAHTAVAVLLLTAMQWYTFGPLISLHCSLTWTEKSLDLEADNWLLPNVGSRSAGLSSLDAQLPNEAVLGCTWSCTCLVPLYLWEVHCWVVPVMIFELNSSTDPELKSFLVFSYLNLNKKRCLVSPMHAYHGLPPVSLLLPPGSHSRSCSKHACGVMSWGVLTAFTWAFFCGSPWKAAAKKKELKQLCRNSPIGRPSQQRLWFHEQPTHMIAVAGNINRLWEVQETTNNICTLFPKGRVWDTIVWINTEML